MIVAIKICTTYITTTVVSHTIKFLYIAYNGWQINAKNNQVCAKKVTDLIASIYH